MNNGMKDILFLAADSGDGQFRFLVDPKLRRRLAAAGIRCHCCFISQLNKSHLDGADAVVLMRTPLIGHAKNDYAAFREKTPWLYEFVSNGGGLLTMFAESYGRTEASLNEFAEKLGISFRFNRIEEMMPERAGMIPNLDFGRTVRATVFPAIPGLEDIAMLDLVVDGGHGTQQLTCECNDLWRPLLKGSESCFSRPFPQGFYAGCGDSEINMPVFGACREFGQGRVAAFPGSSPLWIASAFLPRWNGFLLRQHGDSGLNFITALLQWCAGEVKSGKDSRSLEELPENPAGQREFSFRYADEKELQRWRNMRAFRVWLGTIPVGRTAETIIAEAKDSGCAVAVIIHDWYALTPEKWRQLRADYARVEDLIVVPAYEQLDEEGNVSVVFNVDELPDQRRSYPNSNMLEDLLVKLNGYSAVFAKPEANRLPYWRHGGYNLLEIDTPATVMMFREKVASCGFIGGVHINRGIGPAAEKIQTWVAATKPSEWKDAVSENLHLSFVSSGPRLLRFGLYGERLMIDDWEGLWYEWEDGENADLELVLEADSILTEVTVWDGTAVFARFEPGTMVFSTTLNVVFDHDLHLHVTARDANGGELLCSWPIHTRNRYFWSHTGSDQMNDYHNVFEADSNGYLGLGDRYYEPYGFVTCGYAWGDYVRITPPVPWSDIMPSGIEVSSLAGNFKSFHPSPFLALPYGFDFLNHHFRRLGRCTQAEHLVYSDAAGSWLETPGAKWFGHGGREFHPTRAITESKLWRSSAVYTIPRWQKYQPCRVQVEMTIEWLKDYVFSPGQRFSLGHSLHHLQDGLYIEANGLHLPLRDLLHHGSPAAGGGEKEWDNLGVIPLLRMPSAGQTSLSCPVAQPMKLLGDPASGFSFMPVEVPGGLSLRGWRWKDDGFVLSFDLEPEKKTIRAGERMTIRYDFSAEPGIVDQNR